MMIRNFIDSHADSSAALKLWYKKTSKADWGSFADIREMFNSADYVGNDRYVFNIHGNSYRLVAMVFFPAKRVYIRWIGTHAEYDRIKVEKL